MSKQREPMSVADAAKVVEGLEAARTALAARGIELRRESGGR